MTVRLGGLIFAGMFVLIAATEYPFKPCDPWERNEILNAIINPNKTLWDPLNEVLYPEETYWKNQNSASYYVCPCMLDKPCIRKCCQMNEAMDYDTHHCVTHEATWPWFQPNVSSDGDYNIRMEDVGHFGVIVGNYCRGYILKPRIYPDKDKFYINFTDGKLTTPLQNKSGLGVDWYCLEYIPKKHTYLPYVCFKQLEIEIHPCFEWGIFSSIIGRCISVFFLLISLLVPLLLPDMRNMHVKCLMFHIASSISANVSLPLLFNINQDMSQSVCISYGFFTYFSFLCTYFWLNIMCFDIYVAFSNMKPQQGSEKQQELKKFTLYICYAFGLPSIITLIAIFIDFYPGIPAYVIKPDFATACWFPDYASLHVYFVIPIGVIVLVNVILFVVTAFNIWRREKETSMVHAGNSRRHDNKEDKNRFNLYIRLSVVMGLSWIMEIIPWVEGMSFCFWIFRDLFNALQGVFIFVIFICTDKVKTLLIKEYGDKWPIIKKMFGSRRSETSASTSISNLSSTATNIKMKKKTPGPASSSVPDSM